MIVAGRTETEKANVALVCEFIGKWGKDFNPAEEYPRAFAPNCRLTIESPSDSAVQWEDGQIHRGLEAAIASSHKYLEAGLNYEAEIHEVFASGPIVVTRRSDVLKRQGQPDKPVSAVGVFVLKGGKIVAWDDYMG